MTKLPPSTSKRAASAMGHDESEAQALARLMREIAARDDMLAVAAHELRNPLHALSLHLTLARTLAQGGAHAEAAARIGRAEQSLRRYAERVTVLMELLASPGAVYPLSPRTVDVAALLETLAESLDQEAGSRGVEIRVDAAPAPDARGWVRRVDPVALEQVVDNLLLNAFKHAQATRIVVGLRATGNGWCIQVEDNGVGIAPEDQSAVFEKFAVAAHSARGTGTGLGLWIVTRLVQAMNGDIALRSAPGDGSTFTIRVPDGPDNG